MELMSDFLNISNNRPPRETCFYQHKLSISYESDEKELSVTINNLPPGLLFNQETKTILGTLEDFNLWHPCKDYILNSIKNLPNDSIPFGDCYESLENLVPLTAGYLKNLTTLHYSGKNYGMYGKLAYVADGNIITQTIEIIVRYEKLPQVTTSPTTASNTTKGDNLANSTKANKTTTAKPKPIIKEERIERTIELEVARSPRQFIIDYGRNNELLGEGGVRVTPEEYVSWLESRGKVVLGGC